MELNVELFTKGFVAALIDAGLVSIQPHSSSDRTGFQRVVDLLDSEIEQIKSTGDDRTQWYRQLVRVRNRLQPSNSGAFDSFETALRDLQYSFTSCPNAFYEEIEFEASPPFARSFLQELAPVQRNLVEQAKNVFISARSPLR